MVIFFCFDPLKQGLSSESSLQGLSGCTREPPLALIVRVWLPKVLRGMWDKRPPATSDKGMQSKGQRISLISWRVPSLEHNCNVLHPISNIQENIHTHTGDTGNSFKIHLIHQSNDYMELWNVADWWVVWPLIPLIRELKSIYDCLIMPYVYGYWHSVHCYTLRIKLNLMIFLCSLSCRFIMAQPHALDSHCLWVSATFFRYLNQAWMLILDYGTKDWNIKSFVLVNKCPPLCCILVCLRYAFSNKP